VEFQKRFNSRPLVGDDFLAHQRLASIGRLRYSDKTRCAGRFARRLAIAVLAVPISALAVTPLVLWYIPTCSALIVIVINAFVGRFAGLIYGVIVCDFCHWFLLTAENYMPISPILMRAGWAREIPLQGSVGTPCLLDGLCTYGNDCRRGESAPHMSYRYLHIKITVGRRFRFN
jgi:hypothetical protein